MSYHQTAHRNGQPHQMPSNPQMCFRFKNNPLGILLAIGIGMLPVYVFASGNAQPTHILLAMFSIIVLLRSGFVMRVFSFSWFLIMLSMWVSLVEAVHSVASGAGATAMVTPMFFLYNSIITLAIAHEVEHRGLSPVLIGVLLATSIAAVSILITGVDMRASSDTGREVATFNNPNQLGYFSVCLLSITYFFYASRKINYLFAVALLAFSLFLSVLSLSKAAMVANGLVSVIALKPRVTRYSLPAYVVGVLLCLNLLYASVYAGAFDSLRFYQRLLNIANEEDSSLESRGVYAFLDGDILGVLFGIGSANVIKALGHEVHSTLGSMMNSYGMVGLVLFLTVLTIWSSKVYRSFGMVGLAAIVCPSILYGITHDGSRFAFFWVLVATTLGYHERLRRVPHAAIVRVG